MNGIGGGPIPGGGLATGQLTPETACLRIVGGPKSGTVFPLNRARTLVGRSQVPLLQVDIDLSDCAGDGPSTVHRRHAEISWVGGELSLVHLGGSNGTRVNDDMIAGTGTNAPSEAVVIRLGDKITFSNVIMEVVLADR